MATNTLGHSGIAVSTVGIGCNAFGARTDAEGVRDIVNTALDEGVTFFDTADTYGRGVSEELLGQAIEGHRDSVIIATKFGMDMGDGAQRRGSREYVRASIESSLRRLDTDFVDLYQLHAPDPLTPIAETLGALAELVEEGKVRAIGCSNFQAWQVVDADWTARNANGVRFATAQNEYSLYNRTAEVELAPACAHLDVGILPYFPLAYGLLTGKYERGVEPPTGSRLEGQRHRFESADWERIDALHTFAADRGISILEVAIGGLAAQPQVASVIAGVSRAEQVRDNAAAGRWVPSKEDLAALNEIGQPAQSYTTYA